MATVESSAASRSPLAVLHLMTLANPPGEQETECSASVRVGTSLNALQRGVARLNTEPSQDSPSLISRPRCEAIPRASRGWSGAASPLVRSVRRLLRACVRAVRDRRPPPDQREARAPTEQWCRERPDASRAVPGRQGSSPPGPRVPPVEESRRCSLLGWSDECPCHQHRQSLLTRVFNAAQPSGMHSRVCGSGDVAQRPRRSLRGRPARSRPRALVVPGSQREEKTPTVARTQTWDLC